MRRHVWHEWEMMETLRIARLSRPEWTQEIRALAEQIRKRTDVYMDDSRVGKAVRAASNLLSGNPDARPRASKALQLLHAEENSRRRTPMGSLTLSVARRRQPTAGADAPSSWRSTAQDREGLSASAGLRHLFRPLYHEAIALAVNVFKHRSMEHPCAYLVSGAYDGLERSLPPGWPGDWRRHWQLPETYWGEVENKPPVAFVGINPSIEWSEPLPRYGADFDCWFSSYRNRLGPGGELRGVAVRTPRLYQFYSQDIKQAFGPAADVHTHSIVTDAIHYKSRRPGTGKQLRAALAHETSAPLTLELIRQAGCRVVVLAGKEAISYLSPLLGVGALPGKLNEAVGRVFDANHGIKVVPSYHAWDKRKPLVVGNAVARALGMRLDQSESDSKER
jgi:hypothetical protein